MLGSWVKSYAIMINNLKPMPGQRNDAVYQDLVRTVQQWMKDNPTKVTVK